ncbi:MAG: DNA (cytosine-5-)-methyltransferase [Bacteroidaceae bacterium]|nr:DNA (cytosine-5-)-methyltransferase [Bacteroidaceae bacterium]
MMIKFIDLFAGMGGIRKGFELACAGRAIETSCALTSEIKPSAIDVLKQNHPEDKQWGDITHINASDIPDFDVLLAGFPCQAFSSAGKRQGFLDTRGTMFFEVERILKEKKPKAFLLENVEGLINHDKVSSKDDIGRTLSTILSHLLALGYSVKWRLLNARNFGLAQDRKRVYITGVLDGAVNLDDFKVQHSTLASVIDKGLPISDTPFVKRLLAHYSVEELYGKSLKDKRGGESNIHSWDIELKGPVTEIQKQLLNELFKQRRKKQWAEEMGIKWMDGMSLSLEQIQTFAPFPNLKELLDDLVAKGYLKREHPKTLVEERLLDGSVRTYRAQNPRLPLGYNIVAGKLSFEVAKVLDPNDVAPTLVAMDMQKLYVPDGKGIRRLTLREGLRLFGYPDDFKFNVSEQDGYDLLGNTVAVPVITAVSNRILDAI